VFVIADFGAEAKFTPSAGLALGKVRLAATVLDKRQELVYAWPVDDVASGNFAPACKQEKSALVALSIKLDYWSQAVSACCFFLFVYVLPWQSIPSRRRGW
jgi:hypothetical protein